MLRKAATFSPNGIAEIMAPGDLLDIAENPIFVITDNDDATLTGSDLARTLIEQTGAASGAVVTTLPTANQLVAALRGALGLYPVQPAYMFTQVANFQWPGMLDIIPPGSSYRFLFRNSTGQTITLTAPATSGVTVSGTATIATAKAGLYLLRILNSAPAVTIAVSTTNASKVLSNVPLADINRIIPGMSVYGTGIGASAKVVSVNYDAGTINVDVNSSATADLIGVSFTPTYSIQRLALMDI